MERKANFNRIKAALVLCKLHHAIRKNPRGTQNPYPLFGN
jgi:hypothetical protein